MTLPWRAAMPESKVAANAIGIGKAVEDPCLTPTPSSVM